MQLKLENPKIFADIVSIISELVTEVKLKINSEGMSLTAVDPANVAMVYFKIPADLFSQFDIKKQEIIGVNLESLKAVLRRVKPGSSLLIERHENMLKLGIADRIKRDFSLALLDIEAEEKEMPHWEFNSVIKMNAESFVEVVEDCAIVSDACTFVAEPDKFIVEAHGLNSARAEFSSDELEIHSGNSLARFSLEYLNKFVKGAKISSKATLSFSDNHPMRIDFPTGNVILSFVLAPRIEQED
ncbi:proliferating cell nuclear antigen (pcna) [Candidatus Pacearchaeota archaeon]|nr:proliferating cell nuclear antigen (pcna) [Candidatus Pacearchaeota archaeon]